jgi:hypothetical protein
MCRCLDHVIAALSRRKPAERKGGPSRKESSDGLADMYPNLWAGWCKKLHPPLSTNGGAIHLGAADVNIGSSSNQAVGSIGYTGGVRHPARDLRTRGKRTAVSALPTGFQLQLFIAKKNTSLQMARSDDMPFSQPPDMNVDCF